MDPEKHTFSFQVEPTLAEKINELVGFCRNNGLKCSDGLVMRALVESAPLGPDLIGIVRARKEIERTNRREKFLAGTGSAAKPKKRR